MVKNMAIPTEEQLVRIVFIGVFWGLVEVYLSPVIKSLEPALFGLIMPFIVVLLILSARKIVPLIGSILMMGVIAAVMEYLLTGMVLHAAGGAIFLEALGAELILSIGGMKLLTMLLVGLYVELYSAFHPLIFRGMFCQSSHVLIFLKWILAHFPFIDPALVKAQTKLIVIVSHSTMGVLAGGLFAWMSPYFKGVLQKPLFTRKIYKSSKN